MRRMSMEHDAAMLGEMPIELIVAEIERRGYPVACVGMSYIGVEVRSNYAIQITATPPIPPLLGTAIWADEIVESVAA
jgi:hypothetical protein